MLWISWYSTKPLSVSVYSYLYLDTFTFNQISWEPFQQSFKEKYRSFYLCVLRIGYLFFLNHLFVFGSVSMSNRWLESENSWFVIILECKMFQILQSRIVLNFVFKVTYDWLIHDQSGAEWMKPFCLYLFTLISWMYYVLSGLWRGATTVSETLLMSSSRSWRQWR